VTRFVALGDSITLGIGDPVRTPGPPGGAEADGRPGRRSWRGWAALLAEGLAEPELRNLAGNGARIADVERDQLPRALQLRPDIASVVAGVNDTLRPNFDPALIAAAVAHTVGALRAADAAVLTMRLPDPGRMLGVPGVLARPLARRAHEINLVMDAVAERFGTLHFDAAGDPETYSPGMWAADRLHPSERGHRLIARRFHTLLAAAGHQVGPPPDLEPGNPPPSRRDELAWLATKGTAWVLRRSTDLVPRLFAMAFREWWYGPDADPADPGGPGGAQAPHPAGAGIRGGPQLPAERRGQPVEQERFGAGQSHGEEDPDLTGFGPARLSGA
jgi:lysophospholipase L1-like esterase